MTDPKFIVCPACDGEGYVSDIGAFTGADMDEWYGGDQGARDEFVSEYRTRGGAYDKACDACKGERVLSAAQLAELAERVAYEAECAAEAHANGGYSW